jgi:hypothetical protein
MKVLMLMGLSYSRYLTRMLVSQAQWLKHISLATWEAEFWRIAV